MSRKLPVRSYCIVFSFIRENMACINACIYKFCGGIKLECIRLAISKWNLLGTLEPPSHFLFGTSSSLQYIMSTDISILWCSFQTQFRFRLQNECKTIRFQMMYSVISMLCHDMVTMHLHSQWYLLPASNTV